ncbi:hypothetical protein HK102_012703 [Quaeritorhiza haematococci]|nr:hypothetical protein HK102_012703 [Quaeritorhiza haematococci]
MDTYMLTQDRKISALRKALRTPYEGSATANLDMQEFEVVRRKNQALSILRTHTYAMPPSTAHSSKEKPLSELEQLAKDATYQIPDLSALTLNLTPPLITFNRGPGEREVYLQNRQVTSAVAFRIQATPSRFFKVFPSFGVVPPSGSVPLMVSFTPCPHEVRKFAEVSGFLRIRTEDGFPMERVALRAYNPPVVKVQPLSIDFGYCPPKDYRTAAVVIMNLLPVDCPCVMLVLPSETSRLFQISPTQSILQSREKKTFSVKFTPASEEYRGLTAVDRLVLIAFGNEVHYIELRGTCDEALKVFETKLDFGPTDLYYGPAEKKVLLQNRDAERPLPVSFTSSTNEIRVNRSEPIVLAPAEERLVDVQFLSTLGGPRTETLSFHAPHSATHQISVVTFTGPTMIVPIMDDILFPPTVPSQPISVHVPLVNLSAAPTTCLITVPIGSPFSMAMIDPEYSNRKLPGQSEIILEGSSYEGPESIGLAMILGPRVTAVVEIVFIHNRPTGGTFRVPLMVQTTKPRKAHVATLYLNGIVLNATQMLSMSPSAPAASKETMMPLFTSLREFFSDPMEAMKSGNILLSFPPPPGGGHSNAVALAADGVVGGAGDGGGGHDSNATGTSGAIGTVAAPPSESPTNDTNGGQNGGTGKSSEIFDIDPTLELVYGLFLSSQFEDVYEVVTITNMTGTSQPYHIVLSKPFYTTVALDGVLDSMSVLEIPVRVDVKALILQSGGGTGGPWLQHSFAISKEVHHHYVSIGFLSVFDEDEKQPSSVTATLVAVLSNTLISADLRPLVPGPIRTGSVASTGSDGGALADGIRFPVVKPMEKAIRKLVLRNKTPFQILWEGRVTNVGWVAGTGGQQGAAAGGGDVVRGGGPGGSEWCPFGLSSFRLVFKPYECLAVDIDFQSSSPGDYRAQMMMEFTDPVGHVVNNHFMKPKAKKRPVMLITSPATSPPSPVSSPPGTAVAPAAAGTAAASAASSIFLEGFVGNPDFVVSPDTLNFGEVVIGEKTARTLNVVMNNQSSSLPDGRNGMVCAYISSSAWSRARCSLPQPWTTGLESSSGSTSSPSHRNSGSGGTLALNHYSPDFLLPKIWFTGSGGKNTKIDVPVTFQPVASRIAHAFGIVSMLGSTRVVSLLGMGGVIGLASNLGIPVKLDSMGRWWSNNNASVRNGVTVVSNGGGVPAAGTMLGINPDTPEITISPSPSMKSRFGLLSVLSRQSSGASVAGAMGPLLGNSSNAANIVGPAPPPPAHATIDFGLISIAQRKTKILYLVNTGTLDLVIKSIATGDDGRLSWKYTTGPNGGDEASGGGGGNGGGGAAASNQNKSRYMPSLSVAPGAGLSVAGGANGYEGMGKSSSVTAAAAAENSHINSDHFSSDRLENWKGFASENLDDFEIDWDEVDFQNRGDRRTSSIPGAHVDAGGGGRNSVIGDGNGSVIAGGGAGAGGKRRGSIGTRRKRYRSISHSIQPPAASNTKSMPVRFPPFQTIPISLMMGGFDKGAVMTTLKIEVETTNGDTPEAYQFWAKGNIQPPLQVWDKRIEFGVRAVHSRHRGEIKFTNIGTIPISWHLKIERTELTPIQKFASSVPPSRQSDGKSKEVMRSSAGTPIPTGLDLFPMEGQGLPPGCTQTVDVIFTPNVPQHEVTSYVVLHTEDYATNTIMVHGIGASTKVVADRDNLDFGVLRVGTVKMFRMKLRNKGILQARYFVECSDPSTFSADPEQGVLDGDGTVELLVKFAPKAIGTYRARLTVLAMSAAELGSSIMNGGAAGSGPAGMWRTVSSNNMAASTHSLRPHSQPLETREQQHKVFIELLGLGSYPELGVLTRLIDFGVALYNTPNKRPIRVQNKGAADARLIFTCHHPGITLEEDSESEGTSGTNATGSSHSTSNTVNSSNKDGARKSSQGGEIVLPPYSIKNINVIYIPQKIEILDVKVFLRSSDTRGDYFMIQLKGSVGVPKLTFSPANVFENKILDFGVCPTNQSRKKTFMMTNEGNINISYSVDLEVLSVKHLLSKDDDGFPVTNASKDLKQSVDALARRGDAMESTKSRSIDAINSKERFVQKSQGFGALVVEPMKGQLSVGESVVMTIHFKPVAVSEYTYRFVVNYDYQKTECTIKGIGGCAILRIDSPLKTLDFGVVRLDKVFRKSLVISNTGNLGVHYHVRPEPPNRDWSVYDAELQELLRNNSAEEVDVNNNTKRPKTSDSIVVGGNASRPKTAETASSGKTVSRPRTSDTSAFAPLAVSGVEPFWVAYLKEFGLNLPNPDGHCNPNAKTELIVEYRPTTTTLLSKRLRVYFGDQTEDVDIQGRAASPKLLLLAHSKNARFINSNRITSGAANKETGVCVSRPGMKVAPILDLGVHLINTEVMRLLQLVNEGPFGCDFLIQPLAIEEFSVFPDRGYIEPDSSITLKLLFKPTSESKFQATLKVLWEEPQQPVRLTVVGSGGVGKLNVGYLEAGDRDMRGLDFGMVPFNIPTEKSCYLYNTGMVEVALTAQVDNDEEFAISQVGEPFAWDPNENRPIFSHDSQTNPDTSNNKNNASLSGWESALRIILEPFTGVQISARFTTVTPSTSVGNIAINSECNTFLIPMRGKGGTLNLSHRGDLGFGDIACNFTHTRQIVMVNNGSIPTTISMEWLVVGHVNESHAPMIKLVEHYSPLDPRSGVARQSYLKEKNAAMDVKLTAKDYWRLLQKMVRKTEFEDMLNEQNAGSTSAANVSAAPSKKGNSQSSFLLPNKTGPNSNRAAFLKRRQMFYHLITSTQLTCQSLPNTTAFVKVDPAICLLPSYGQTTLTVEINLSTEDTFLATLAVKAAVPNTPIYEIPLTATPKSVNIICDDTRTLNFHRQPLGEPETLTRTFTNVGHKDINFRIINKNLGLTIEPSQGKLGVKDNQSITIHFTFKPLDESIQDKDIIFEPDCSQPIRLKMHGGGGYVKCSLAKYRRFDFGHCMIGKDTISYLPITNEGNAILHLVRFELNESETFFRGADWPLRRISLAPNKTYNLPIVFNPREESPSPGQLIVGTNTETWEIELIGLGREAVLIVAKVSMEFIDCLIGNTYEQKLGLKNVGDVNYPVTFTLETEFRDIEFIPKSLVIQPFSQSHVVVSYTPTKETKTTVVMTVSSPYSTHKIPLSLHAGTAVLEFSSEVLDFGMFEKSSQPSLTLKIKNVGTVQTTFFIKDAVKPSRFGLINSKGILMPNETTSVTITHLRQEVCQFSEKLIIRTDLIDKLYTVEVKGQCEEALVRAEEFNMLNMGICPVLEATIRPLEFKNYGRYPLNFSMKSAYPLKVSPVSGSVPGGETMTLNVAWKPSGSYELRTQLSMITNIGTYNIIVRGKSALPEMLIKNAFIDFGVCAQGCSYNNTFSIVNKGKVPLRFTIPTPRDPSYAVKPSTAFLAPKESMDVEVIFTPAILGRIATNLLIDCKGINSKEVVVGGIGGTMKLSVNPSVIQLGRAPCDLNVSHCLELRNQGEVILTIEFLNAPAEDGKQPCCTIELPDPLVIKPNEILRCFYGVVAHAVGPFKTSLLLKMHEKILTIPVHVLDSNPVEFWLYRISPQWALDMHIARVFAAMYEIGTYKRTPNADANVENTADSSSSSSSLQRDGTQEDPVTKLMEEAPSGSFMQFALWSKSVGKRFDILRDLEESKDTFQKNMDVVEDLLDKFIELREYDERIQEMEDDFVAEQVIDSGEMKVQEIDVSEITEIKRPPTDVNLDAILSRPPPFLEEEADSAKTDNAATSSSHKYAPSISLDRTKRNAKAVDFFRKKKSYPLGIGVNLYQSRNT